MSATPLSTFSIIAEPQFPALYRAADRNSLAGQRRYLMATALRLATLVAAALFGLFTWRAGGADLAGVAAAVAFGAALSGELYLLKARPDRLWYDGRAAAESAKTLTWRYVVAGNPFPKNAHSDQEMEELLLRRFSEIARELKGVHLVPVASGAQQVTTQMRQIRALPLEDRREQYRAGRVHDQRDWYARQARWHEQRATFWSVGLAVLELLALAAAVLKATGVLPVDLLGLAATLAGVGAAWVQTRQHHALASAYAVASQELAEISVRIDWPANEQEWAHFVDHAEAAISREHTMWRASRC